MKKYAVFLGIVLLAVLMSLVTDPPAGGRKVVRTAWTVMGTEAALNSRGLSPERLDGARRRTQAVFGRLDGLLSAWNPASELSRVAKLGEREMLEAVSPSVRPCYLAAFDFARKSGNAFNPRVGRRLRELEPAARTGTADFDLGAIAKGFAVDEAWRELSRTVTDAEILVDLGGNLRVLGGEWTCGIRNPFARGRNAAETVLRPGEAVATSGNYERFVTVGGVRMSHILDGRTLKPVSGIAGVTVIHPSSAMVADALSTALFVLGPKAGMELVGRHFPEAAVLWIPDEPTAPRIVASPSMAARLRRPAWRVEAP